MELKRPHACGASGGEKCLNRTFYGIETILTGGNVDLLAVLIVPFMELKQLRVDHSVCHFSVLIVPFMELKQQRTTSNRFKNMS